MKRIKRGRMTHGEDCTRVMTIQRGGRGKETEREGQILIQSNFQPTKSFRF